MRRLISIQSQWKEISLPKTHLWQAENVDYFQDLPNAIAVLDKHLQMNYLIKNPISTHVVVIIVKKQ